MVLLDFVHEEGYGFKKDVDWMPVDQYIGG